jgi:transcriptional regulator with XRE-family HTH domain
MVFTNKITIIHNKFVYFTIFVGKNQHVRVFNTITMGNTNTNWVAMSDTAIVGKIGEFIKNERLNSNKTQAQLAVEAGINRWTLSQIENGEPITLLSLIQILRALNRVQLLEIFTIQQQQMSPIELAKKDQQKRQRASSTDTNNIKKSDW